MPLTLRNPLKSHLFWFILLGAAIFAVDALRPKSDVVIVDDAVASRIASLWEGQMGRPPTTGELANLLDSWLAEEILYREARALELDKGDAIVRRRLVQKMNFIAEEAALEEPDEASLREYYDSHLDEYALPRRTSFRQLRLPQKEDAEAIRETLASGANWRTLGAPGLQSPEFALQTPREITSAFGKSFAESVSALEPSPSWYGPIESEFGWHLVQVTGEREAGVPPFDSVRELVKADLMQARREAARTEYLDEVKERYEVRWQLGE